MIGASNAPQIHGETWLNYCKLLQAKVLPFAHLLAQALIALPKILGCALAVLKLGLQMMPALHSVRGARTGRSRRRQTCLWYLLSWQLYVILRVAVTMLLGT